ncbi:hypothetical protein [Thetidibacter halocola]|uniref:Uncharacterized protein n=1 Tax=Thetidibacter halocola TaxID=2827239 RepID=A0A8J7WG20_9RHOB|nr:hypothetical protein [Thetidibacter halocola]MBS0125729.1 hypothetical protein [Thetidibacter halocola]
MAYIKTQIGEIAYNPALECFEALVTFHTAMGRFSVAASYDAPLTAEFDRVSDGLLRDALRNYAQTGTLRSRLAPARRGPAPQDMQRHAA